MVTGSDENGLRDVEALAEWLYVRSGGIFWRGETTWQDRHREEARQWFAYADLLARVPPPADAQGETCEECETTGRNCPLHESVRSPRRGKR